MAEITTPHIDDVQGSQLNGSAEVESSSNSGSSPVGRPPMESYMQDKKPAFVDDSTVKHYRDRCSRLEGELHDADRKIRQQVDEIMQLKRELSKDRTETLLTHQKELSEAKESHRNEIERLKEAHRRELKEFERQSGELEKQLFKMEMEHRAGGRDAGSRLLDMLEENAPMFVSVASQLLAGQKQGQPQGGQPGPLQPAGDVSDEEAEYIARQFQAEMNRGGQHPQENERAQQSADPIGSGQGEQSPARPDGDQVEDSQPGLNEMFAERQNGHPETHMEL